MEMVFQPQAERSQVTPAGSWRAWRMSRTRVPSPALTHPRNTTNPHPRPHMPAQTAAVLQNRQTPPRQHIWHPARHGRLPGQVPHCDAKPACKCAPQGASIPVHSGTGSCPFAIPLFHAPLPDMNLAALCRNRFTGRPHQRRDQRMTTAPLRAGRQFCNLVTRIRGCLAQTHRHAPALKKFSASMP